jgi:hypothetical protein
MAQQNKQVGGAINTRRAQLERDLIGQESERAKEIESGRRRIDDDTPYQRKANKQYKMLAIQQGFRRRHPSRVLNQYHGVNKTTSTAATSWEKALLHETKRTELPREFRPKKDEEGMVNQLGVVSVALDNYKSSRGKFERMHMVGV